MSRILVMVAFVFVAGCATGDLGVDSATVRLPDESQMQWLGDTEIRLLAQRIQALKYPMTRAEAMDRLELTNRALPGSITSNGRSLWRGNERLTSWSEQIRLEPHESTGRPTRLLLWYDSADTWRVIYAEILHAGDTSNYSVVANGPG